MDKIELQKRTQLFAVNVIRFVESQSGGRALNILTNQLLRSSTSIGANYRSACKGKSSADFINKIVIVEEEADESSEDLRSLSGKPSTTLYSLI